MNVAAGMPDARYRRVRAVCLCIWLGLGQFVIVTLIAMVRYPGGQPWDTDAPGYSFWHNTLSDLGKNVALNGEPNAMSNFMLLSGGLAALISMTLWLVLPWIFACSSAMRRSVWILGVFSVAGMALALCTPGDSIAQMHGLGVFMGAVPALVALSLIAGQMIRRRTCPRLLAFATMLLIATAGANLVLFATHFWLAREWAPIDPLAEKLVAIYVLGWILAVSWHAWQKGRERRMAKQNAEPCSA